MRFIVLTVVAALALVGCKNVPPSPINPPPPVIDATPHK